ncbi:MAG: glycosyltransferase family 2 protein [Deltaproteobacteria bacterium]|nr:glycosyltransferase family 2 protein [Deltaproteobacteria bacterium]
MIDLTIAIVNWNTDHLLEGCLRSIKETIGELSLQVVVVDNKSSDQSAVRAQKEHPWAEFIYSPVNAGFSSGNNLALAKAQGRYFLLLNPDTVVQPGALQSLKDFLDENPATAAAGPRMDYGDGSLQQSWSGRLVSPKAILADTLGWKWLGVDPLGNRIPDRDTKVKGLMGACIMLRKSAIDQVGPMDDKFFLVYEEADLCHRLIKAGWSIWYLPQARITHFTGQSSQHIPGKGLIESYQSLKYYLGKHYGRPASWATSQALICIYIWWSLKTAVKEMIFGYSPELESRKERFNYILHGLLTSRR